MSHSNWITITSGASGSGNGSVNYSVATNTTTTARSGVIAIAGVSVSVDAGGHSAVLFESGHGERQCGSNNRQRGCVGSISDRLLDRSEQQRLDHDYLRRVRHRK